MKRNICAMILERQSMKQSKSKIISVLCILGAGILWGTMGIFVRHLAVYGFRPLQIACLRIVAAGILFFLYLYIVDKEKLKIKKKDLPLFIGMGWGSILFFTICYFMTIQTTSLAVAAILLYTSPIFVMLLSAVFLKEKITGKKLTALVLAFLGCILMTETAEGAGITKLGFLIGLCSGLGYGLYSIFGSVLLKKYHPYTVSSYAFIFAGMGALVICDAKDITNKIAASGKGAFVLCFILLTAVVTAVVPFLLYTVGLANVEAGKAAIMAMIEPLMAAIVGIAVFGETLTIGALLGMICVFLAILILNLSHSSKEEKQS